VKHLITQETGYMNTGGILFLTVLVVLSIISGTIIGTMGMKVGVVLLVLPIALAAAIYLFQNPLKILITALVLSFFISGLTRYIKFQWGLGIDIFLVLAVLSVIIREFRKVDLSIFNKDIVLWSVIWMTYVVLEIANPEARSITAWFYAMRGIGLYQLLTIILVLWLVKKPDFLIKILHLLIFLSVLGAIWALKQKYIGTDAAEDHWLWAENHHEEHVLFGVLRAFSFYSDAGQFGASQAMFALISGILILQPGGIDKRKILYAVSFILILVGFLISGSRGALAIPAIGGITYMIFSKNFKILITGFFVLFTTFYLLKYTHVAHGNEQIRRIRTALAEDNPSLNARLRNQITFGNHLRTRPFGGGVGSAGFWGNRFSPNTLLADTPTDSYYVKIWAETGIVGLCLHVLMLGYFVGKGGAILWNIEDVRIKYQIMAMFCGVVGVLMASYGNQVFSQMPTGMIMNIFIPLIFLAPTFDHMVNKKMN
jgi:hypothetical protein